jgi:hypothetical protein
VKKLIFFDNFLGKTVPFKMSAVDSDFCIACRAGNLQLAKSELKNIVGTNLYREILETSFSQAWTFGRDNICEWISGMQPFFVFERRRGFTIAKIGNILLKKPGTTPAKIDRTKNF